MSYRTAMLYPAVVEGFNPLNGNTAGISDTEIKTLSLRSRLSDLNGAVNVCQTINDPARRTSGVGLQRYAVICVNRTQNNPLTPIVAIWVQL